MCRSVKACVVAALLVMLFKETTSARLDARFLKSYPQYVLAFRRLNNEMTDFGPFNQIRMDAKGNFWKHLSADFDRYLRSDMLFNEKYEPINAPKPPPQQPQEENGSNQPEYISLTRNIPDFTQQLN